MIKGSSSKRRDEKMAYALILPFLSMFIIFKLYPMVYGLVVSFLGRNSIRTYSDTTFRGFENYLNVLQNPEFWASLGRSFIFSLVYTVFVMVVGFFLALMLNRKFRTRTVVRTMFYLPYVTNIIAVGIVFKFLFNPTKGPINALLKVFGITGMKWLTSPDMALPLTALIAGYLAVAFNVITVLAALQDVPSDLYEVAKIEGTSTWQNLVYVTLPCIKPALWMLLTITIINSFKNYTVIQALTEGGPGNTTTVLSMQIYNDAFIYSKYSYAAAEGVFMTIFIVLVNQAMSAVRRIWDK